MLVTVGTTRFDALVAAADSPEFAAALAAAGFTSLVIQAGTSEGYRPHRLVPPGALDRAATLPSGLHVRWFEYAPSLAAEMAAAAAVVCHAGAGSVFEALRAGVPCIAVPNPLLMDNHQRELAEKLEADGHLAAAVAPEAAALAAAVARLDAVELRPYVPGNGAGIVARVDALCGVQRGGDDGRKQQ